MSAGDRRGRRGWLLLGGIAACATGSLSCDAALGIPGDLRDRAANGTLREGGFGTLSGGPLSATGPGGVTLSLRGAALSRRVATEGPSCVKGLCLRGSLSSHGTTGGGQ